MYEIKLSKSNSVYRTQFENLRKGIGDYEEAEKIVKNKAKELKINRKKYGWHKNLVFTIAIFREGIIMERIEV